MTQATVNVVKNLNPNAQHFMTSDFTNGTVFLTGSAIPSDDPYGEHGADFHLRSTIYPTMDLVPPNFYPEVDPSVASYSLPDGSTASHPYQLTRPYHPTMPEDEQGQPQTMEITMEQRREAIRRQLNYYFSEENLLHDEFLQSKMNSEGYVPISIIAGFNLLKRLTDDLPLIIEILKELPSVEVDAEEKHVRSIQVKVNPSVGKRCIIILRDVPMDATETEISNLFNNENCPARAMAYERVLGSGKFECWYVTFSSEDEAQNAFLYLTRENVSIRGQKVLARMKARLRQNPSSVPSTSASTPVSPPITNGGATSPPPASVPSNTTTASSSSSSSSGQVPTTNAFPNANYSAPSSTPTGHTPSGPSSQQQQHQQQQQQQPTNATVPQYSTQSPYNPTHMHPNLYITTGNPNQTTLLGNIQAAQQGQTPQQNQAHYRATLHHPLATPTGYPTAPTNAQMHPPSLEQVQQLPHVRIPFPNYPTNISYDRTAWLPAGAHQQTVQNPPTAISFATATQPTNMPSYQPPPIYTTNPNLLHGNVIYMTPHGYQTSEPYSTMSYSGSNKGKPRMARDHQQMNKPRNSNRPLNNRNSRQEGPSMSNESLDYGAHSTPHSEGSSSPVPLTTRPQDSPVVVATTNIPLASNTVPHPVAPTSHSSTPNEHPIINDDSASNSVQSTAICSPTEPINDFNTYQPLEQRKVHHHHQHPNHPENETQQPMNNNNNNNKKRPSTGEQQQQQQPSSIPPLMPQENRSNSNSNRPSSSQQSARNSSRSNSSTPLSVSIPKVSTNTYYNQNNSTSSPQSPKNNVQVNDNNGPRSYADTLKIKQNAPTKSTISPPNESNDSRAQSPSTGIANLALSETNGSTPDLSTTHPVEPSANINDSTVNPRRNSSASTDHPNPHHQQHPQQQQQHQHQHQQQHYNPMRGRIHRGNHRRSAPTNFNRGTGRGGRRSMNHNVASNGSPGSPYQGRARANHNPRYFDRPRGAGTNYHNSNPTVHRFTGNTVQLEPQVHSNE